MPSTIKWQLMPVELIIGINQVKITISECEDLTSYNQFHGYGSHFRTLEDEILVISIHVCIIHNTGFKLKQIRGLRNKKGFRGMNPMGF